MEVMMMYNSVVLTSMRGGCLFAAAIDEENSLDPDQSQDGTSEETVSIVELIAHSGVGEDEHHQKETQVDPVHERA